MSKGNKRKGGKKPADPEDGERKNKVGDETDPKIEAADPNPKVTKALLDSKGDLSDSDEEEADEELDSFKNMKHEEFVELFQGLYNSNGTEAAYAGTEEFLRSFKSRRVRAFSCLTCCSAQGIPLLVLATGKNKKGTVQCRPWKEKLLKLLPRLSSDIIKSINSASPTDEDEKKRLTATQNRLALPFGDINKKAITRIAFMSIDLTGLGGKVKLTKQFVNMYGGIPMNITEETFKKKAKALNKSEKTIEVLWNQISSYQSELTYQESCKALIKRAFDQHVKMLEKE